MIPLAIWMSRHPVPDDLCWTLRDHRLLHVRARVDDYRRTYFNAFAAAGRHPDLLFFVVPRVWRCYFVEFAQALNPSGVLVRAFESDGVQAYRRMWIEDGVLRWEAWQPEGARAR